MSITETIKGWFGDSTRTQPIAEQGTGISAADAAKWIMENLGETEVEGSKLNEAFTQADIELALDDRGWLVGGKRQMGELDPLSRQVQVNRSRYYWLRDPLAKQAIRLWTDYTFGDTGINYDCDDASTKKELDKFTKDRRNKPRYTSAAGQQRLSKKLLIDGELFIAIFEDGSMRTVDCLQITDIICDADDEDVVVAYKRIIPGKNGSNRVLYYKPWDLEDDSTTIDTKNISTDGYNLSPVDSQGGKVLTYVPKCVMYHLAFDAIERRGNGLLTSCSDWAREHRRFMVARVAITQALSKFAFKTTVKGGQNMVNSIRAKLESTFAQSGLSGGTEHNPVAAPGANFLSNEGVTIDAMPRVTGGAEAKTDASNLKLMVCAGTGIAEHYFGDAANANLATATAMELPMLKMFMGYQVYWKEAWRDIFAIVLQEDVDSEPADITITLPAILEDDLQSLSAFLTSLVGAFPEAKVPQLLRMCLESANVPDLDDVMDDIEANKEEIDAQNQLNQQQQHANAMQLATAKGPQATDPSEQGVLDPGTPQQTEAASIKALTAALLSLKESLKK
jgi:hypothetical protein